MKFVPLHDHSCYSYMDGYRGPEHHVNRVAELGIEALALTEHGNVSSHVQLEKAATKSGIRPIYGLEAYTSIGERERRKFHLTLLAMNEVGYANLMRIVSRSYAEGFYQWPTVSGRMLADHHEGLIVLSGCADSLLACSLLGGKSIDPTDASWGRARSTALGFKRLLGDRYYLECQMFPELERTRTINQAWERLSDETGIPLVATADVHYPFAEDNEMQKILHAAGRGAGSVAAQEASWEYDIRLTYPVSDRVAYERTLATGLSIRSAQAALRATGEIAIRCAVTLPKADRLRYPLLGEPEQTSLLLIWRWLREGWKYRVQQGNRLLLKERDAYSARVKYEMDLIGMKDFVDYFLMISDIVRYAKENGCPVGPARGSAAASLVCYLLRITEIDPMQHPLMMFERFIAPDREDIPDIDLDFDDERRSMVREYAVRKYGADRVGNIANYTKYKGKSALKDVGRVFPHIPKYAIDTVAAMVIERSGGDSRADAGLMDTVEMFPAAKEIFEKYKDLYKATRLEGDYRGMSVHAAGLVITERPVNEVCALYTRERMVNGEKVPVTVVSVDKKDAEYLGLMKVDFLGLSTMGMIRIALELAGLTLEELYRVSIHDAETLAAFNRNDVVGIFQYEGRATRLVNREVRPDNFQELADINGLSRPGPLFSGTTADYIDIKHGRKRPENLLPVWDEITAHTKGQIIYQEQVLKALREVGGLPVGRVHELRKIISQKLGEAQFNSSSKDWIDGAIRLHGIDAALGQHMWGRLVTSASYSFNLPHCVSYSMLGFWCMWLKMHHPVAFYTAALRKSAEEHWPTLIKDADRHGIAVRGVDPPRSGRNWEPDGKGNIVAGWLQVPGIGPSKADAILAYRDDAKRLSPEQELELKDLINVNGIGTAMMAKIEAIDPADPFGLSRVGRVLAEVRAAIESGELPLSTPTHTSDQVLDAKPGARVVFAGLVKLKEYKDFIEDERARTGDDLEEIKARMKDPHLPTGCVLHCYDDGDEDVYVRIHRRSFPKHKRDLEQIRPDHHVILVIAKKSRNSFGASLYVDKLYWLDPPKG